jgi:hypothetical protein
LHQGTSFSGLYFAEHILQVAASELHAGEGKKRCRWSWVDMDQARLHTSKRNLARIEEMSLKRVPHPPCSPDIAPLTFFLFEWLKDELSSRQVSETNGLFEIVDDILSILIPDTIVRVFGKWIERLTQIININGDCV